MESWEKKGADRKKTHKRVGYFLGGAAIMGAARLVQAASGDNDVAAHADDVHSNLNHTPAAAEAAQLPGTENPTVGRMSTDTPPPIVVSPHTSPEQNPT